MAYAEKGEHMYTSEQLEAIAHHFNVFVEQDADGNVVANTSPNAETGWRPVFKTQCDEALAAYETEVTHGIR